MLDLVIIMKALADETRIRILNLLYNDELCVYEIERLLGINQSNASRHLNKLSTSGLVKYKKNALFVFYYINKDAMEQYPFLKEFLAKETIKLQSCRSDIERLNQYKSSGLSCEDLKNGKVSLAENRK